MGVGVTKVMVLGALVVMACGCKSWFPSSSSTVASRWHNYDEVAEAFAKVIPNETDAEQLKALGMHPAVSPNIKILTYVDIIQIFMPNPGIRKEDLPVAVREVIEAQENGSAYLLELHNIKGKRHGNLLADMFGFKRKTHESGWEFKGLILLKGNQVAYKLSSGAPQISRDENRIKPLGPLQEVDKVLSPSTAVGYVP